MDAHFATFKDTPMGLNDDEEPYALSVCGRSGGPFFEKGTNERRSSISGKTGQT